MYEAISWTIRLRNSDSASWQAFTGWLEANPEHVAAYENVAMLDEKLDGLAPATAQGSLVGMRRQPRVSRRWLLGGAGGLIAASVVAVLMLTPATTFTIRTEPGQTLLVALDGGSEVHLNGGTIITLDSADPRFASLESGEALFSVISDPNNPFRVEAGPATIRNIGTVFNVEWAGRSVEVGLAKGAVEVTVAGQAVKLAPGAVVRLDGGTLETSQQNPSTIGTWRSGELSYSSANLAEVARDISRSSGISVRADPSVAGQRFSGTIILDKDRERLRQEISALLGVDIRVAEGEWILAAPDR